MEDPGSSFVIWKSKIWELPCALQIILKHSQEMRRSIINGHGTCSEIYVPSVFCLDQTGPYYRKVRFLKFCIGFKFFQSKHLMFSPSIVMNPFRPLPFRASRSSKKLMYYLLFCFSVYRYRNRHEDLLNAVHRLDLSRRSELRQCYFRPPPLHPLPQSSGHRHLPAYRSDTLQSSLLADCGRSHHYLPCR